MINHIGEVYDKLKVISYSHKDGKNNYWICQCDCGNTCTITSSNLSSRKSCGCYKSNKPLKKDLTGMKFYRLTVIGISSRAGKRTGVYWKCLCDCGNYKITNTNKLLSGVTKSCGCLTRELARQFMLGKSGPLSPKFNPNKTYEERERERKLPNSKKWSSDIKLIFNYTCQICNKKGGILVSHHLFNYKDYPDLRLDINNGVCLCSGCHEEFHRQYGKNNNTKEQFELFQSQNGDF